MVLNRLILAWICGCLAFVVLGFESAHATPRIEQSYGALDRQKLDIYPVSGPENAPVVIFVHGGGWHFGKKDNVHRKPVAFNAEGIVFVSVGYPLLPEHPVEAQARSVAMAIGWIVDNIDNYNGDPTRLHLMGHSAGAHLAALAILDNSYLRTQGVAATSIKSIISVDGATLNVPWRMRSLDDANRFARRMFRKAFGSDPDHWRRLSPYHHISEQAYLPPFLFLTAEARTASNIAADDVVARLRQFGGAATIIPIQDRNHASINRRLGSRKDAAFNEILNFIRSTDLDQDNH